MNRQLQSIPSRKTIESDEDFLLESTMRILIALLIALIFSVETRSILGSPQAKDLLTYGTSRFAIDQIPMLGLWYYGEGAPPEGKQRPPKFDFESFNNWVGYSATWSIHDSRLYLAEITGKMGGKEVKNAEILPGGRFPRIATWFTGKIHLPVGDFDNLSGEYESVIVFEIQKGRVIETTFSKRMKIPLDWDGIDEPLNVPNSTE